MARGGLGRGVLAAIDAGEGSFGEVEEDLGVAEEETAGITFLEPIDLPARERAFPQQHADVPHRASRRRPRPWRPGAARARPARAWSPGRPSFQRRFRPWRVCPRSVLSWNGRRRSTVFNRRLATRCGTDNRPLYQFVAFGNPLPRGGSDGIGNPPGWRAAPSSVRQNRSIPHVHSAKKRGCDTLMSPQHST